MSNKIISINSSDINDKKSKNYTYLDIDMESTLLIKLLYINTYETTLITENADYDIITEDGEYIETCFNANNISFNKDNSASNIEQISGNKFKISNLKDLKAIQNSLHNIFTWIPGERILNPEFGSKLYLILYNGITDFSVEQIISEIRNSVSQWEPRVSIVKIVNISNINDTENNTIRLDIVYTIPSLTNNKLYIYTYKYNKDIV